MDEDHEEHFEKFNHLSEGNRLKHIHGHLHRLSAQEDNEMTVQQDIQAELDAIQVDEAASGAQLDAIEIKINAQQGAGGISADAAATLLANVKTIRQAADAEAARIAADATPPVATPPSPPSPVVTTDPATGNVTTVTTNTDGTHTTVVTDTAGVVLSSTVA